MAADSNETFIDVEGHEGSPRTEKIFCAFVTSTPDCPKDGLMEEFLWKGYIAYVIKCYKVLWGLV